MDRPQSDGTGKNHLPSEADAKRYEGQRLSDCRNKKLKHRLMFVGVRKCVSVVFVCTWK